MRQIRLSAYSTRAPSLDIRRLAIYQRFSILALHLLSLDSITSVQVQMMPGMTPTPTQLDQIRCSAIAYDKKDPTDRTNFNAGMFLITCRLVV